MVQSGETIYQDTIANFTADIVVPVPGMPAGCVELIYQNDETGQRHALIDAKQNQKASGPIPWDFAERAIQSINLLSQRQKSREAPILAEPIPDQ